MIRRPPRSTLDRSSAASDVYKRQVQSVPVGMVCLARLHHGLMRSCGIRFHVPQRVGGLSLIHISEPHETVLDLVCRLLLEKKKNKTYTRDFHCTFYYHMDSL